ncbi:hypothetical protein ACFQ4L_02770 [Lapidilactobacillus mulanensis]|uniref:DUF1827 family protein n=1 Tax=Lapidilactobacillus mulanensis TaxID=2485999 RepID=A0ABW4DM09_9LACO|nr:hypothetical protein [Lapidilactobacillus mulanensis]
MLKETKIFRDCYEKLIVQMGNTSYKIVILQDNYNSVSTVMLCSKDELKSVNQATVLCHIRSLDKIYRQIFLQEIREFCTMPVSYTELVNLFELKRVTTATK